jgi:hypothetical protein
MISSSQSLVGVPVFIDPYVPEFKSRHPSVQRWWPRVLKALGEPEGGERAYWLVGGGLRIHPNNADSLLKFVDPIDEVAQRRARKHQREFGEDLARSLGGLGIAAGMDFRDAAAAIQRAVSRLDWAKIWSPAPGRFTNMSIGYDEPPGAPNCRCALTPDPWWRRALFFFEKRWLMFKLWRIERLLRKAGRL